MILEWGQRLDLPESGRVVVFVAGLSGQVVRITATGLAQHDEVKWIITEDSPAASANVAAFGRSKGSGLPALAIHCDRMTTAVTKVVVSIALVDQSDGPLRSLDMAVDAGSGTVTLPRTVASNGTAIALVQLERKEVGWSLLAQGDAAGTGILDPTGGNSTSRMPHVEVGHGRRTVPVTTPAVRPAAAVRPPYDQPSRARQLVGNRRTLSLLVIVALVCGAAWVVIPKYRSQRSATTSTGALSGALAPEGSVVFTNLDGSVVSDEVAVSVLPSASNPPADMTAVGPIYDVVPARPLGSIVVTLAVPAGVDPAQVVVGRAKGKGWEILGGLPSEDGRVSVMVDHFSKLTMFLSRGWSEVVGIASDIKRVLGLGSIGDPPVCDKSNTQANATVTSTDLGNRPSGKNFRVDVCTERADTRARLKLVNRRAVAVRIEAHQATLVDRTIPGAGDLVSIALSALAKPLGGHDGALIPPGGQIVLEFPDEVQTFPMDIDPAGIAWSVLLAAAGGIPGGWKALADTASSIDFADNGANASGGKGWEDLVRQGLAKFFEVLAKAATGVLKAVLRLASGMISTIILAVRGELDIYVSMSGSSFADATYRPAAASKPLVPADLLSAPVPSLCGHPAGRLVNGKLPGISATMGFVSLRWTGGADAGAIAVGNVDGKPGDEIAAVVECSQGGIGHPASVQIYGPGPALLGSANLGDIIPVVGQAILRDIRYSDGSVLIRWATGRTGDCLCLPTIDAQARVRLSGTQLVVEDVRTSPAGDAPITTTTTTAARRSTSGCPIAGATGRYVATLAVGGVSCERVSTVWAAYEKAGGPSKSAQGVLSDWGCVFPRADKVGVVATCVSDSDGTAFDVSKA